MPAFTTMARGVGPVGVGPSTTMSFVQPAMPGLPWTNVSPGGLYGALGRRAIEPDGNRGLASSWDWQSGRWRYYRMPPGAVPGYGDRVKHPEGLSGGGMAGAGIGEVPELSAHSLPAGSTPIGVGDHAIGTVVQPPETTSNKGWWIAAAAVGLLLWMGRRATRGLHAGSLAAVRAAPVENTSARLSDAQRDLLRRIEASQRMYAAKGWTWHGYSLRGADKGSGAALERKGLIVIDDGWAARLR